MYHKSNIIYHISYFLYTYGTLRDKTGWYWTIMDDTGQYRMILDQRIARVLSKSWSRQLWSSLDQSRSRQPLNFPVSIGLCLDNFKILQSPSVLVSTIWRILSLKESWSRQLEQIWVSNSLGLDNFPIKTMTTFIKSQNLNNNKIKFVLRELWIISNISSLF